MEQSLNILVVDDSPTDLLFFTRAVKNSRLDIRLLTLMAAHEAIDYLNAKGQYGDRSKYPWPDLIVLDLKMPGVNGFDFLAWRKASELFLSVPVIVCSGSSEPKDVKRIFQLGANRYVLKPTAIAHWQHVVQEVWDFGTRAHAISRKKALEPGPSVPRIDR